MNPTTVELKLPFLGQRTYLHGTTLFNALQGRFPGMRNIDFRLFTLIQSDRVAVEMLSPGAKRGREHSATLLATGGGAPLHVGVAPLEPSGAIAREPFDEGAIVGPARLLADAGRIELDAPAPFPFVTTVVALHKALLLKAIASPPAGQWLFTRLELKHVPETFGSLVLERRASLGLKLVRSDILVDSASVGSIYFSWWQQ